MRKVGAIKKVGSVSANDGVARLNAYRAALSARDWGEVTRTRLEGPGPPTSQDRLLPTRLGEIFAPARLSFTLQDPSDGFLPLDGENCPFQADLDHEYDWLHLALVEKLPGDLPVQPNCGRCLMMPDRCDDREIARSLARLLGLRAAAQGLMSAGTEPGDHQRQLVRLRANFAGRALFSLFQGKAIGSGIGPILGLEDRNFLNVFLTQKIPYVNSTLFSGYETFRDRRLAVIADQSYRTPSVIIMARGLAWFLGLRFRKDDQESLASHRGAGTAMNQEDIKRAR